MEAGRTESLARGPAGREAGRGAAVEGRGPPPPRRPRGYGRERGRAGGRGELREPRQAARRPPTPPGGRAPSKRAAGRGTRPARTPAPRPATAVGER